MFCFVIIFLSQKSQKKFEKVKNFKFFKKVKKEKKEKNFPSEKRISWKKNVRENKP